MKSALQLELEDLHGLPYVAGIIWFVLLGICLLSIAIYFFKKNLNQKEIKKVSNVTKNGSKPKGF